MARAVRIDATVVEADICYLTDAGLAWQGARALARQGRKLTGRLLARPGGWCVAAARQDGTGDLTDVGSAHGSAARCGDGAEHPGGTDPDPVDR